MSLNWNFKKGRLSIPKLNYIYEKLWWFSSSLFISSVSLSPNTLLEVIGPTLTAAHVILR